MCQELTSDSKTSEYNKNTEQTRHNCIYIINHLQIWHGTNHFVFQIERDSGDTGEEIDDIDTAYLLYNESVIYFHVSFM